MKALRISLNSETQKDLARAVHDPITDLRLLCLSGRDTSAETVDTDLQNLELAILNRVEKVLGTALNGEYDD